jgi:hypothetical protein
VQLRVGRAGEAHHGQPADRAEQRRDRELGHERPGRHDDGGEDQHPARVDAAVGAGGGGADHEQRGEPGRQRERRREPPSPGLSGHLMTS